MQAIVPSWTDEQPLTFLILGVDRRQQEIPRSDAIIVVNIDPVERRATLISVPRDLYVDIAGYGVMRINQTFVRGGAQLTRRTVEAVLGLPVDYFVKIEFDGFERIIDTLGGVEVELAQPLYDPYYPDDADGFKPLRIPAGRQRLNGAQALGFARSRLTDPEADFGRSKRPAAATDGAARSAPHRRHPPAAAGLGPTVERGGDYGLSAHEGAGVCPAGHVHSRRPDHPRRHQLRSGDGSQRYYRNRGRGAHPRLATDPAGRPPRRQRQHCDGCRGRGSQRDARLADVGPERSG